MNVDFYLPEFSETKIVSRKYHMDKQTNRKYDMILCRYLLTALGLDINFSENITIGDGGSHKRCSAHMANLSSYKFKPLTDKIVKP